MNIFATLPLAVLGLSGGELVAILLIILLLFGGTKLPSLARGLGQSVKEFKKASREDEPEKPAENNKPAGNASTKTTGQN